MARLDLVPYYYAKWSLALCGKVWVKIDVVSNKHKFDYQS